MPWFCWNSWTFIQTWAITKCNTKETPASTLKAQKTGVNLEFFFQRSTETFYNYRNMELYENQNK